MKALFAIKSVYKVFSPPGSCFIMSFLWSVSFQQGLCVFSLLYSHLLAANHLFGSPVKLKMAMDAEMVREPSIALISVGNLARAGRVEA